MSPFVLVLVISMGGHGNVSAVTIDMPSLEACIREGRAHSGNRAPGRYHTLISYCVDRREVAN